MVYATLEHASFHCLSSVALRCAGIKVSCQVRDWSLITGMVGYKTAGGHMKFYPYEKGWGGRKKF